VSDKSLVIVESPAKAKTIAAFLGPEFIVESSIGHIRDLPRRASDVPAKYKKEPWARLGVDVDNDFKPLYIIDDDKKEHIKRLKALLATAHRLYLATDEDREGESIAWHLLEVLSPKVPVLRMAFHEITKKAIQQAIQNPRDIDQRLVNAQEARRILDRLYGYEVSPVLWKKVMPKLSAGRVQSVATRIVVDREAARMRFSKSPGPPPTDRARSSPRWLPWVSSASRPARTSTMRGSSAVLLSFSESGRHARSPRSCRQRASSWNRWSRSPTGAARRRRS
jgi:DNA topoisomerase I